ncbi:Ribonuclease BN [Rhodovulum sp. P5]|uniref:YihY/virulence factor BrkB family protein n=1 Tax=Rhodovulum sp. P5 TaxID=1564506 RepID=UPI0009C2E5CB|nr:YihY/virulence factor BrkB family protein [Rhodovulum sp. P5]ARE40535.1 Ribonuclease BN [Rhodovulum sp. P5]
MTARQGHSARVPAAVPAKGWKDILLRVWKKTGDDHMGLISAGIAFYGLLALFPAITALVAIGGLVLDPEQITAQIDELSAMLPDSAAQIVAGQAADVAGSASAGLGFAAIFGVLLALYSASKGVASLIEGLNLAYDETEARGIILQTVLKFSLTAVLIVGVVVGLSATVILPGLLGVIDLGPVTEWLIRSVRWAILLGMTVLGIGVLYRFGPSRRAAEWRWLTPGAVVACALWLAASVGFAYYTDNFASYNESFGALSGVIVLLTWMWMSAYVLLLGAVINAEAELQTRHDTTIGPDAPMGERGAVKADTLPPGE